MAEENRYLLTKSIKRDRNSKRKKNRERKDVHGSLSRTAGTRDVSAAPFHITIRVEACVGLSKYNYIKFMTIF